MNAPLTASTSPLSSSSSSGARYWASRVSAAARRPRPVKWASAPSGVGNERLAAWSKVPSGCTSRQLAIPMSGRASISRTIQSSAPGVTSVSGLSSST